VDSMAVRAISRRVMAGLDPLLSGMITPVP
jgi:hypothetical protein